MSVFAGTYVHTKIHVDGFSSCLSEIVDMLSEFWIVAHI